MMTAKKAKKISESVHKQNSEIEIKKLLIQIEQDAYAGYYGRQVNYLSKEMISKLENLGYEVLEVVENGKVGRTYEVKWG